MPKGAKVVIDTVPEARHGADLYELSSVNWADPETGKVHEGLEWALSPETADHHFGEKLAGVHLEGEEPKRTKREFETHECELNRPRPPGITVKQGTDLEGNRHPWSLFHGEKALHPIWFCPFCGEEMSMFPPEQT